jgi:hypothetical protein
MEKMLFLFTFVASVLSSAISTSELLIQTDLGPVKGVLNNAGAREWSAIPYADPPVGEKRWTQPVSPVPWNETFDSNFQPNGCAQACGLPVGTGTCPENVSEDCLYLSVFSPNLLSMTDPRASKLVILSTISHDVSLRLKKFHRVRKK